MYFDNLTLAGLLVTVAYTVMLIMFSRVKTASDPQEIVVPECLETESYCC